MRSEEKFFPDTILGVLGSLFQLREGGGKSRPGRGWISSPNPPPVAHETLPEKSVAQQQMGFKIREAKLRVLFWKQAY